MSRLRDIILTAVNEADTHLADCPLEEREDMADQVEMAILDAAGGPDHLVSLKGSAWTCQHPLTERFEGDLFDCKMTTLISLAVWDMRKEGDGQYRVKLDRNALTWVKL
jgi:hypothetical protein